MAIKKVSKKNLVKMVKDKDLEVTRDKTIKKPAVKPDKSSEIVVDMAKTLATSAEKMAESTAMMAKIADGMKSESVTKDITVKAKKRKWRFTPIRDQNLITLYTEVEEL